jgi:ubiquinone/menaquinone biosynthesis C-methylase UbiE
MFWPFNRPERYDRLTRWIAGRLHRRVAADVAALDLPAGSRVLDVGTGPGRVPQLIAEGCPQLSVEGIDLSAEMIATARTLAAGSPVADRVAYVVGDVAALPYPDDSIDLVVSTMSQHHWPDLPASLRELRRVVRPDGRIWIYDARIALRTAETTARELFPDAAVHREVVRSGRFPIHLVGRLVVDRGVREHAPLRP